MCETPEHAGQLDKILDILNQTIGEIRHYIFDLRRTEPTREFERVLKDLVRDLRLDTILEVDLSVTGQRCWEMSPQQVAHLTQIARETLSNVIQHAQAQHVGVELHYANSSLSLSVMGDGSGLATQAPARQGNTRHGIANIRDRTDQLGGRFDRASKPGRGTRLAVPIPCGGFSSGEPRREG
jgi:signal transduction histidine kinase